MANETSETYQIEGLKLDKDNAEFNLALDYALHTNRTMYLTGKAGTGKTTFLKYLRTVSKKKMVVLAPTGVAAVNAGGQTIHSFFKIEPSVYVPGDRRLRTRADDGDPDRSTIYDKLQYKKEKVKIIESLETIVIDEISMVRCDLLDVVDTILRVFRHNNYPFGGVQMLLIGDTFQLPPVVKEERDVLYKFYDSEFFFSANVMKRISPLYIELKKIYRQSDKQFIDLLNKVRENKMQGTDYQFLNSKLNQEFRPDPKDNYIILATTNAKVNDINDEKLAALNTEPKTYMAMIEGDFPEKARPTATELILKVGAQIMFVKNDYNKRYYNGKIGIITKLKDDMISVELEKDGGKSSIDVTREEWQNIEYQWNEEEQKVDEKILGTFRQFPVRLAWSITVHKSQGLTFEKVYADLGNSFAPGQVYVALSRCTSMDGLVLASKIGPSAIRTDSRVMRYAQTETPRLELLQQLDSSKADFCYEQAREALHNKNASACISALYEAIGYRNDVQKDEFRRYVSVWFEKLLRDANASAKSSKETKEESDKHAKALKEKDDKINEVTDELNALKAKMLEDNSTIQKSIKLMMEETESKSKEINDLKSKIKTLKKEKSAVEKQLEASQKDIKTLEETAQEAENKVQAQMNENKELKAELERIRNLSWLDKLFGKK